MPYIVRIRQGSARGPIQGEFGPFAVKADAIRQGQALAGQASGSVVTVEAGSALKRNPCTKANPWYVALRSESGIHGYVGPFPDMSAARRQAKAIDPTLAPGMWTTTEGKAPKGAMRTPAKRANPRGPRGAEWRIVKRGLQWERSYRGRDLALGTVTFVPGRGEFSARIDYPDTERSEVLGWFAMVSGATKAIGAYHKAHQPKLRARANPRGPQGETWRVLVPGEQWETTLAGDLAHGTITFSAGRGEFSARIDYPDTARNEVIGWYPTAASAAAALKTYHKTHFQRVRRNPARRSTAPTKHHARAVLEGQGFEVFDSGARSTSGWVFEAQHRAAARPFAGVRVRVEVSGTEASPAVRILGAVQTAAAHPASWTAALGGSLKRTYPSGAHAVVWLGDDGAWWARLYTDQGQEADVGRRYPSAMTAAGATDRAEDASRRPKTNPSASEKRMAWMASPEGLHVAVQRGPKWYLTVACQQEVIPYPNLAAAKAAHPGKWHRGAPKLPGATRQNPIPLAPIAAQLVASMGEATAKKVAAMSIQQRVDWMRKMTRSHVATAMSGGFTIILRQILKSDTTAEHIARLLGDPAVHHAARQAARG